jgi:hypothetical protein
VTPRPSPISRLPLSHTPHPASVDERKNWLAAIQTAHASVAPAAAPAIAASLAKQNAVFDSLDTGSQARLHAMFLDLAAPAHAPAPKPRPRSTTTNSSPSPSFSSQPTLENLSAATSSHTTPDPRPASRLRSLSTTPQFSSDESSALSSLSNTEQAAASASHWKSISSAVSVMGLVLKKGATGYNRFGRLGSLMEQAAGEEQSSGLDVLQAECQALEACVRKVPNFANVSAQQMQHTLDNAMRKTCAAGELLLKEGDFSSNMLYIHSGSVTVSSASKGFIAQIYSGNIVGHHSYIYRRPRTATIHAAKEQNTQLIYYEFMFEDTPLERPDASRRSTGSAAPHSASSSQPSLSPQAQSFSSSSLSATQLATRVSLLPSSKADNALPPPFLPAPNSFKRGSLPALPSVDEGASRPIRINAFVTLAPHALSNPSPRLCSASITSLQIHQQPPQHRSFKNIQ